MIKRNKWLLLITSIVILMPMVVGLILWNSMPERVPMHWNFSGEVDGWGSRTALVFVMPLVMLGFQWLCILGTFLDPKNKVNQGKVLSLVLWICPVVCNLVSGLTYAYALGYEISVAIIMSFAMGLIFVIIGNYLPKCKQNYTIGIKIPWTLNNEGNWGKTHRFAGRLWVLCGGIIMATSILGNFILFMAVVLVMVTFPFIYSYAYYRRHSKEEA